MIMVCMIPRVLSLLCLCWVLLLLGCRWTAAAAPGLAHFAAPSFGDLKCDPPVSLLAIMGNLDAVPITSPEPF